MAGLLNPSWMCYKCNQQAKVDCGGGRGLCEFHYQQAIAKLIRDAEQAEADRWYADQVKLMAGRAPA